MTPLVLVVALAAGPPRSLPLLKPTSPTALVAFRVRGGAADQEVKQSDVDAMRITLVAVRNLSAVLAVLISLSYVKPLYREWFKGSYANLALHLWVYALGFPCMFFLAPWKASAFALHSWRPKCYSAAVKDVKWPKGRKLRMLSDLFVDPGRLLLFLALWAVNVHKLTTKDHGWGAILSFWNDVPRPVFFLYVAALVGVLRF